MSNAYLQIPLKERSKEWFYYYSEQPIEQLQWHHDRLHRLRVTF